MLKTNMKIGYLITPYEAWNKPEKEEEWQAKLLQELRTRVNMMLQSLYRSAQSRNEPRFY
jgi:hypothetical protein